MAARCAEVRCRAVMQRWRAAQRSRAPAGVGTASKLRRPCCPLLAAGCGPAARRCRAARRCTSVWARCQPASRALLGQPPARWCAVPVCLRLPSTPFPRLSTRLRVSRMHFWRTIVWPLGALRSLPVENNSPLCSFLAPIDAARARAPPYPSPPYLPPVSPADCLCPQTSPRSSTWSAPPQPPPNPPAASRPLSGC